MKPKKTGRVPGWLKTGKRVLVKQEFVFSDDPVYDIEPESLRELNGEIGIVDSVRACLNTDAGGGLQYRIAFEGVGKYASWWFWRQHLESAEEDETEKDEEYVYLKQDVCFSKNPVYGIGIDTLRTLWGIPATVLCSKEDERDEAGNPATAYQLDFVINGNPDTCWVLGHHFQKKNPKEFPKTRKGKTPAELLAKEISRKIEEFSK